MCDKRSSTKRSRHKKESLKCFEIVFLLDVNDVCDCESYELYVHRAQKVKDIFVQGGV